MFLQHGEKTALIDRENEYTYDDIKRAKIKWLERFRSEGITPGMVVGVQSDFSFSAISLLFALFENNNIAALVSPASIPIVLYSTCCCSYCCGLRRTRLA